MRYPRYNVVYLNWLLMCWCLGFPGGSAVKNPPVSAGATGDMNLIPGSGRSPRGGNGTPLQYSCLENPMDRGAWQTTVHSVAKSWTQLKQLSMRACVGVYPSLCSDLSWKRGNIIDWPKWIVQEVKEAVVRAAEVVELCLQLWALFSSALFQSQTGVLCVAPRWPL